MPSTHRAVAISDEKVTTSVLDIGVVVEPSAFMQLSSDANFSDQRQIVTSTANLATWILTARYLRPDPTGAS